MNFRYLSMNKSMKEKSEDNFNVLINYENDKDIKIIFADGAGGVADGFLASKSLVEKFIDNRNLDNYELYNLLEDTVKKTEGASTVIVAKINEEYIEGFSVGDSEFLFLDIKENFDYLTDKQYRKPLVGDGGFPIMFHSETKEGIGIIGSDGLWNYIDYSVVKEIVSENKFEKILTKLYEAVKLPNDLWDDLGVIIFEIKK